MSHEPGSPLGPYTIVAPIGAGGMGEVYRAHDSRLDRDVALKILPPSLVTDTTRLLRFEREARAAGALSHPNLVTVYELGIDGNVPYIAMELLDGETLREHLARRMPLPRAVNLALQIAQGLAATHAKGVVHRDLKPENIIVTRDGRVKIFDFGLAKVASAAQVGGEVETRLGATNPGTVLGTVGYMSPEQVRGEAADERSDIFALGAVLYEMLSGRRAFTGKSSVETLHAILNEEPADLSRHVEDLPPPLGDIVQHCLEKDPAQRFQSARDLAFAIQSLGRPFSSGVSLAATGTAVRGRSRLRGVRQIAVATALVMGGILVGLLGPGVWNRRPPTMPTVQLSMLPPPDVAAVGELALSPDGSSMAFLGVDSSGVRRLWVRKLDSGDARVLQDTEAASAPFWSPDSRSIGFFANGKLKRADMAGGPTRVLAEVSDPRGGTWNADGVIVFAPHAGDGLYRIAAEGGAPVRLTALDAARQEMSHRWPAFLPDGRHLLFLNRAARSDGHRLAIFAVSIDRPSTTRPIVSSSSTGFVAGTRLIFMRGNTVFAQRFDAGKLELSGEPAAVGDDVWIDPLIDGRAAFTAARDRLAYRAGRISDTRLLWVDRNGKPGPAIGPRGASFPDLSPDGRRLVSFEFNLVNVSSVWLTDLERGSTSRLTSSPANELSSAWSPDGTRLAFASDRAGSFDLFEKRLGDLSPEREILRTPYWKWPESWSPDGRHLLFVEQHPDTRQDLRVLPMGEGGATGPPVPFVTTRANECCARFSPDGRSVAYVSDQSGRQEVFVRAFPGGTSEVQVSVNGGAEPQWRGDGNEIFYLAADNRMMAAPVRAGGPKFDVGLPVPLFQTRIERSVPSQRSYAVTGRGDRFIVAQLGTDVHASAITVIVGWGRSKNGE